MKILPRYFSSIQIPEQWHNIKSLNPLSLALDRNERSRMNPASASSANRSQKRQTTYPMGWVLVCVIGASIMCGIVWHGRAFIMTGTLTLIAAVGVLLPYFSIQKLFASIVPLQARGQVGQGMPIRIQIENRNGWAWGTTIVCLGESSTANRSDGNRHEHMLPRIERRGVRSEAVSLVPANRGLFPGPSGSLVTRFPFGLFTGEKTFTVSHQSIIWPEIVSIAGCISDSRYSGYESSATSARHWGDEGDIAGPRPYRPGESLRRVHWRHTARRGDLIVCERESTTSRQLRIQLELVGSDPDSFETSQAYEAAISIAASLISDAIGENWHVDFKLLGHRQWKGVDHATMPRVFDYLATFDANGQPREEESVPAARRDSARSILVTQRSLADGATESWHDEILCTNPTEPGPGLGARCVWLPPHSDWRKRVQQRGAMLYGST